MNDKIKEDVSDLMELLETTSKKEFYRLTIDHELVVRLYNYITNLRQEKEDYKSRCEKASEYINCRIEEFKNAGKSRKEIKAHQYYMLLCDIEKILVSSP